MKNFIRSAAIATAMMLPQSGNAQTAPGTANTKVATVTAALAALHKALDKDPVRQTEVANLAPRVKDGTIDSTDNDTIRTLGTALYNEYATNPAIREKIMAVANALKGAGEQQASAKTPDTLHADVKASQEKPPIGGWSPAQKARKQWEENTAKNANGILGNPQAVTYNTSDTAVASLKIVGNTRIFTVKPKERKPKAGSQVKATANFTIKGLPAGTAISYSHPKPENMKENVSEVGAVRVIFINQDGKAIDADGNENPSFFLSVGSGETQQLTIPPKGIGITEKIDLPLEFDTAKGVYPEREFRVGTGVIKIMPAPEGELVGVGK